MISSIQIARLRVIQSLDLQLSPDINVIYGHNASGKTSFLESLALLSQGRSFRSHKTKEYITQGETDCLVRACLANQDVIAIHRFLEGKPVIRYNQEDLPSVADLAQRMPMQLINQQAFDLLDGPSALRRAFLDWAVFHVEQGFMAHWQTARACLHHRNAALRQRLSKAEVLAWDRGLIAAAEQIDALRGPVVMDLATRVRRFLPPALSAELEFIYHRGWKAGFTLNECLDADFARDYQRGYTHLGPHRADIKICVDQRPASTVLSRGQQKVLIMALLLARGDYFHEQRARPCLYLIDDLAAELDQQHQAMIVETLTQLQGQLFITSTEKPNWTGLLKKETAMFHVEHPGIFVKQDQGQVTN